MLLLEKDIKSIKYYSDLEIEFYDFLNNYSFSPNRAEHPYPKIGDVLDEDKSVRWNREEVERLRKEYEECVAILNKNYAAIKTIYVKHMISLLAKEFHIKLCESEKIWNYVYSKHKEKEIYQTIGLYEEIVELYKDLSFSNKKK